MATPEPTYKADISLTSGQVFETRVTDKFLKNYRDDDVTRVETNDASWYIKTSQIVSIVVYKNA